MPSSPSPTTSTRAATISSRKARRSNSFPSFASLNPFRAKPAPQAPLPRNPFLVGPGIWSTDATAEVFGYIQTDAKGRRKLTRSQSAEPAKRNKRPALSSKSVLQGKSLLQRYKEVHDDDGTDDYSKRTHRRNRERWERARQNGRDEAREERENSEWRSRRGRMRTVSQDDQLTERGANPRTGVISPYVMSDGSANSDYIAKGYAKSPLSTVTRKTSNGRWQQSGGSWSFVEESVPSPTRLQTNDKPIRQVSVKKIQDKLLAQMPGVDDPQPDNMSNEQIRRYQQSVERACDLAGGTHAMVDPDTLPTPRQTSPTFGTEGPSTPPMKLHKIRRKEVGSPPMPERSDDTVIVNPKQRPSDRPPAIRMPSSDRQKVRIMSPSMAALGAQPRTPLDVESSFLGSPQRRSPTASAGRFPSKPPLMPKTNQPKSMGKPQYQEQMQGPSEACCAPRASSPTLSQFLPRLQFLHPSHFANLESPACPRPSHLLPPSLRSGPQKRQLVEDAATITTITTSELLKQRPGMQRSEGRNAVPRASHRNIDNRMASQRPAPSQPPFTGMVEPGSPTKSTERLDTKMNGHQPMSASNAQRHNGHQGPMRRRDHHYLNQEQSSPYQSGPSPPRIRVSPPHVRSNAAFPQPNPIHTSSNQHHPQKSFPQNLSSGDRTQSGALKVTSSEFTDRSKEIGGTLNLTTNCAYTPYPRDSPPRNVEECGLQVNQQRTHCRTGPNHVDEVLKGPETIRSAVKEMNQSTEQHGVPHIQMSTSSKDAAIHGAKSANMEGAQYRHLQTEPQKTGQRAYSEKSNARGANCIASDHGRRDQDANSGIIQTYDLQDQSTSVPGSGIAGKATTGFEKSPMLTDSPNGEGGICFAGDWADKVARDADTQSISTLSTNAEELLSRQHQKTFYLNFIQQGFWHMIIHVASTLHHGSPAIKVLMSHGSEKAGDKERLYAVKEVVLAVIYLLILLNLAMLLRKLMMTMLRVVYWLWNPFAAVGIVVRWCLIA